MTSQKKFALEAFHWIIDILEKTRTPYQITGGLAAKVYGSDRELADIDIDIPEDHLGSLVPWVIDFLFFGPQQFKNETWDLMLMRLDYKGQEIDLGGAFRARVFDQISGEWVVVSSDFSTSEQKEIFGRMVPVVAKSFLIDYKTKLGRDVDLIDIANLRD